MTAGRTFFVTGVNTGIGRALVEALAAAGGQVVLASRSAERTAPVLAAIRSRYPGAEAEFVLLDLADLSSVRRAAQGYLATGRPLDVLVNNAGVAGTRALSADRFDLTYATNHIGPFLLTNLLLPKIRESAQGRVVNVASAAHLGVKRLDWSGLERRVKPKRSAFGDYAVTKLMNVLHVKELARRLEGTTVTTHAVHPGAVASDIWRALPQLVQWLGKRFLLTNEEGARAPFHAATAPELAGVSGRYYDRGRDTRVNPLAESPTLARELWSRTEAAVQFTSTP